MRQIQTYQEYIQLVEELIEHDRHYYDEAKPLISDYEYDQRLKQLKEYEEAHPDDVQFNSPTTRVSESPTKGFVQREHLTPMLSLANTYSEEEVGAFMQRVEKNLEKKVSAFCCELKMDGVAISLHYKNGKLLHAITRGNGQMGDDVTQNIKTIRNLPIQLTGKKIPDECEVRGEVYLTLEAFHTLNEQREEMGLESFANPRNAAAGSLKLLDSKEVARRGLQIVCYGMGSGQSLVSTQEEILKTLRSWKLPCAQKEHIQVAHSLEEVMAFGNKIQMQRKGLPFEIDGIVIKVNDLALQRKLGTTGKTPRFACAYKFAPEQALTKILDISVQVGRTGVLTPVAELEPVVLSGSRISRATLHNQAEIQRKDIRIGDHVFIEKGGDVIPKVVAVSFQKRPVQAKPWMMPERCPICQKKVVHPVGEVAMRCSNPTCPGKQRKQIIYFASKQGMDIEHMGEKVVEQLIRTGRVHRISDIYRLTEEDLLDLEGFKEKSVDNLLRSIDASRKCSLSRFIMSLGIPYVGKETAEALAEEARDLSSLQAMSVESLVQVEGVGEKTAYAIAAFLQNPDNREEIHRLIAFGVTPQKLKKKIQGHPFAGKTFVLTGSLTKYTREEAASLIRERGGKVSGSVSQKTDYILVGKEPGSKLDKGKKLGIQLMTEKEFESMVAFGL